MTNSEAVDQTLDSVADWEAELDHWRARIGRHTRRVTTRDRAFEYLENLLADVNRRNSWQLAEAAGELHPYAFQHLLSRARWTAAGVRDEVRAYAVEHLQAAHDVLVIDETGFLKQGQHSAGVQRQYSGTAGRIENCQIGVFLTYASRHGHALIDRELYLPQSWLDDPARCRAAGIPENTTFATKPQLAQAMLTRAFDAGVAARWVVGDAVYGDNRNLRQFLETQRQAYVLAVSGKETVWLGIEQRRVKTLIAEHSASNEAWHRLSAGAGTKGERTYDWACLVTNPPLTEGWARGLLLRRSIEDPDDITAYVVFAPDGTLVDDLVAASGSRWPVERCFLEAKDEVGLDEYEVRCWLGWYRHITLVMAAHAFLGVTRAREQKKRRRRPGHPWA
jgi:SRSO17 transposase